MAITETVLLPRPQQRVKPSTGIRGGEPIIIKFGEFICQLSSRHHIRISSSEIGWKIGVTGESGGFPVQYLILPNQKIQVPTRKEAIACAWTFVTGQVAQGNSLIRVTEDMSLLPDDVSLLKQIIHWQQTIPFTTPHPANAKVALKPR